MIAGPNLVGGSKVKVVGMGESQHSQSCTAHAVCGTVLLHTGSYICFCKTRFVWQDGEEEDVVEVFYLTKNGLRTCKKVGYLLKNLADGLCTCTTEVYSRDCVLCVSVAKRQKFH